GSSRDGAVAGAGGVGRAGPRGRGRGRGGAGGDAPVGAGEAQRLAVPGAGGHGVRGGGLQLAEHADHHLAAIVGDALELRGGQIPARRDRRRGGVHGAVEGGDDL